MIIYHSFNPMYRLLPLSKCRPKRRMMIMVVDKKKRRSRRAVRKKEVVLEEEEEGGALLLSQRRRLLLLLHGRRPTGSLTPTRRKIKQGGYYGCRRGDGGLFWVISRLYLSTSQLA
jgi:hypothetical protein